MSTQTVILNGNFDVIHVGHVNLLMYARSLAGPKGDVIVFIDTDERIKQLKGRAPIFSEIERLEALLALMYPSPDGITKVINLVHIFASDVQLSDLCYKYRGSIMVKGEEYRLNKVIGSQYVDVVHFKETSAKFEKISSSSIRNRIINAERALQKKSDQSG